VVGYNQDGLPAHRRSPIQVIYRARRRVTTLIETNALPLPPFWGHMTSSVTLTFDSPYVISYWWSFETKPLSLMVSNIFNGECDAMVDTTLNDLYAKVKVIHFGTNRFLIYDFL